MIFNMWNYMTKKEIDQLSYEIVGAIIEVHKIVGPGMLEKFYQRCLAREFKLRGISYENELIIPYDYKGESIHLNLICDFFVENSIVVELKAVQEMHPIFNAQIISYMKVLNAPKGILVNFNVENIFKQGQKTFVNKIYDRLPDY
ncbi:hypothetical protein GCM10008106_28470 [Mongoliitalea lutea]|uniref:GxxExxY protein n=2 Tax=Mongoliitalea lutea TaxID=849756 RepID=A0A8J3G682_9BACT|nr:hypothetical protein GCM10008106_28470 [Mongoliitalea lutea]